MLREGYPRALLAGCAVSFTGVALIAAAVSDHGVTATWSAALCLIAALVYAGGIVAEKPAMHASSALAVTWLACTVAAVAALPYAPELWDQLGHARSASIGWMVYLGVGPLAIGFGTWAFALGRMKAGRLGIATYLVPPLVVLQSWIFLGETPPLLALPGGLLCLAGVAVARRQVRHQTSDHANSARALNSHDVVAAASESPS